MTLDLSAYKPVSDTVTDADAITAAFTALETWGNALPTSTIPSGAMTEFGGTSAPSGWFICDGSAISRTTYAALFAQVSTLYGIGDGSSTFNLPDKRGRVGVGYAASGGHTDVATIGNNDGLSLANRRSKHKSSVVVTSPASASGVTSVDPARGNHIPNDGGNPGAFGGALTITVGPQTGAEPTDTPAYLVSNTIIKT